MKTFKLFSLYHQHTPAKVGYSPCLFTYTENMPAVVNLIGVMSNHLLHMAAGALYIISGRIISTQSGRWRSLSIQITFLFWILGSISWRDWIILSNDIFLLAMHGQESFLFLHQRHAQDPSSPVIIWLCVTCVCKWCVVYILVFCPFPTASVHIFHSPGRCSWFTLILLAQ